MLSETESHMFCNWTKILRNLYWKCILDQTQYFQFICLAGVHQRKYSFYHQTLMASKCTGFHVLQKILSRRQLTGGGSTCVLHQNQDSEESRKVGTCMGSWSCQNPECSFLKTEKTRNTTHFEYRAGSRACYSCGQFAAQAPCGARKLIQHAFGLDHTDVYHFGYHECELKQEVANDREYTKDWVKKYPGLSFRDLKTTVIQTFLDDANPLGAKNGSRADNIQSIQELQTQPQGRNRYPRSQHSVH